MIYLKIIDGNIIGHDYYEHDDFVYKIYKEPSDLVNEKGKYIYKLVGNKLITLTNFEYENHPNIKNKDIEKEIEKLTKIELKKLAYENVKTNRPDLSSIIDKKIQDLK
jgi:hypothetical protein